MRVNERRCIRRTGHRTHLVLQRQGFRDALRSGASRLWATVGHGIINEVYWPSTGQPQIRDFGFYLVGKQRLDRPEARAPLPAVDAGAVSAGPHHHALRR